MNIDVYVIIRKSTGEIAHHKAYFNVRDAKLALKYHNGKSAHNYAVARIGSAATVVAEIDENGRWRDAE